MSDAMLPQSLNTDVDELASVMWKFPCIFQINRHAAHYALASPYFLEWQAHIHLTTVYTKPVIHKPSASRLLPVRIKTAGGEV